MSSVRLLGALVPWLVAAPTVAAGLVAAQETGSVAGTVVSTITVGDGEPVPGVTIRIPAIPLDVATDRDGRFVLHIVPTGEYEIRAELLGCPLASRTIAVRRNRTITVSFTVARPAIELPGVVAAGVAGERPDAERPYAVGVLDLDEREGHPGRSIADLLRGQFPGVEVLQGSGQPGSEVRIQLRGPASISGDRPPLVVVDGIITTAGFIDINPEDVRTIRVLKGGASAAEYGARGEAGVIEITTRGGVIGSPTRRGPLVVVDGEISETGLRDVDPGEIVATELVTGARAAVLFGPGAAETGVVRVTTREGALRGVQGALSRCVPPPN